jgi:hypothetical protein
MVSGSARSICCRKQIHCATAPTSSRAGFDLSPIASPRVSLINHQKPICEVVKRAVSDPPGLLTSLGGPDRADIKEIYRSPDLSIFNVLWAPHMMVMPHDHHMWAIIGAENLHNRRLHQIGRIRRNADFLTR